MKNKDKIILDLCGGTGSWSKPYRDAGYDVRLITLPDQDVRNYLPNPLRHAFGILAAPPCTAFSGAGARWWPRHDAEGLTEECLEIFDWCMKIIKVTKPDFWALENPVGRLKRLRYDILGEPKLIFNPCDYGDPYTKKTLLWGNFNLPIKSPVEPIEGSKMWAQYGGKSERTKRLRSMTPQGFAKAFFEANQG
jgi:hypothetical protein